MGKLLIFLLFFSASSLAQNSTDLYTFTSSFHRQQFYDLTHQLRCLVCQNQTLADSDAPLAQDMRKQILLMVNQGATNDQINQFLVKRYGEFISYQPPFNHSTLLLWITPAILLVISILFLLFHRRSSNTI